MSITLKFESEEICAGFCCYCCFLYFVLVLFSFPNILWTGNELRFDINLQE